MPEVSFMKMIEQADSNNRLSNILLASVAICAVSFAFLVLRTLSAQAEGYDPNARSFLKEVVEAYEFYSLGGIGGSLIGLSHRFGPPGASAAEEVAARRRGKELYEQLRRFEFRFVDPVERGDSIRDLRIYHGLKKVCAAYPRKYWDVPNGRLVPAQSLQTVLGVPPTTAPYAPGEPRPIDYELAFLQGIYAAPATEGFALYRLSMPDTGGTPKTLYVLRAEEYRVPVKAGKRARKSSLPGSLAAFDHPNCVFRGSIDFYNRFSLLHSGQLGSSGVKKSPVADEIKGQYLAEIVEMGGKFYGLILTLFAKDETSPDKIPEFFMVIWELDFTSRVSGSSYMFSTRRPKRME